MPESVDDSDDEKDVMASDDDDKDDVFDQIEDSDKELDSSDVENDM